jgi:hypothetical protein
MGQRKPVWASDIEEAAFRESQCRRCFQPAEAEKRVLGKGDGCPHLAKAADNKLPKAWTRKRLPVMGETYKCDDFQDKPKATRRRSKPAVTEPLIDVEPAELLLVPVDGWPDYRAEQRKDKKGEHQ